MLNLLPHVFLTVWYSPVWFSPFVLADFEWENPVFLYFLLLVPLMALIRWLFAARFSSQIEVAFMEEQLQSDPLTRLRYLPSLLFSIFLMLLLIAAARPQRTNEYVEQNSEGIDIMLVLDISESMLIEDFKPNRLEATKRIAINFIEGRKFDRIGMVIFSGEAYSLSPLTNDYAMLRSYIQDIHWEMIQQGGTAIGSALAVATNRMRELDSRSKVLVLISDGDSNAGNIDPITAAQLAYGYGIKLYTIIVGQEGRVPVGKDKEGNIIYEDNTIDEETLREIARIGQGNFYHAQDNKAMEKVFEEIDQLEKSEIIETRFKATQDHYHVYLRWALLFFLAWLALKSTFITNVLQD
ncbi:VWA domain-containing protein [Eisenibacter elegans]|uniref:VWA domain-containing protein n=1 Tax=Eisenibacter elegans TaxID=997 RepID=UPI0003F50272|nr:VWA domain-containing protein [Eisenibacter elegans]